MSAVPRAAVTRLRNRILSGAPQIGLFLALIAAVLTLPQTAIGQSDCKRSQDCALDAFKSGAIKPLPEVLAVARSHVPGEVVKIELEREDGLWVYEIKILIPSGRRRKIEINAQTLSIIKID